MIAARVQRCGGVDRRADRERWRSDQLRELTVRARSGDGTHPDAPIPLGLLGRPTYIKEPAQLRTELGELVAYAYVDLIAGVDLQDYVERAKREVDAAVQAQELHLEPGERIDGRGSIPCWWPASSV